MEFSDDSQQQSYPSISPFSPSEMIRKYSKITPSLKAQFLDKIFFENKSIKKAANELNINYSSAKTILYQHRKTNCFENSSTSTPIIDRSLSKTCGFSSKMNTKRKQFEVIVTLGGRPVNRQIKTESIDNIEQNSCTSAFSNDIQPQFESIPSAYQLLQNQQEVYNQQQTIIKLLQDKQLRELEQNQEPQKGFKVREKDQDFNSEILNFLFEKQQQHYFQQLQIAQLLLKKGNQLNQLSQDQYPQNQYLTKIEES